MCLRVKKYNHPIKREVLNLISDRYYQITKAINREFWNSDSETDHSLYVGSYGRGTAISTSDIDVLFVLPDSEYERFSNRSGNGQSQLLQVVKKAVEAHYATTDMSGDGQVVQIRFSDGIIFEVLPAFKNNGWSGWDGTYKYPDTNMGGNWMPTNPLTEQDAIKDKNSYLKSNGLLIDTCKHIRYIRDEYEMDHLSGILIDSFVYNAISAWHWLRDGEHSNPNEFKTYEEVLLSYYDNCKNGFLLFAPGSGMRVSLDAGWDVLGKILKMMV